jgi:hypothetical protein
MIAAEETVDAAVPHLTYRWQQSAVFSGVFTSHVFSIISGYLLPLIS